MNNDATRKGSESISSSQGAVTKNPLQNGRGGPRKGAGRKQIPIDPARIEQLRAAGCPISEIADLLGVELRTLQNRMKTHKFKIAARRGRAIYKYKIRLKQVELVERGDPRTVIHLGRTVLKQRASESRERPPEQTKQLTVEAFDELLAIADEQKSGNDPAGTEDGKDHA